MYTIPQTLLRHDPVQFSYGRGYRNLRNPAIQLGKIYVVQHCPVYKPAQS